jgi:hypothetical protein
MAYASAIEQAELVSCSSDYSTRGWLLSKHSTMFQVFFDPRIEISNPNNPHYHVSKVSLMSPLARNGCQSWTFSVQIIKALCCWTYFLAGNSSLGVNTPSSSRNVYFTNEQTDRILVPYGNIEVGNELGKVCKMAHAVATLNKSRGPSTRMNLCTNQRTIRCTIWCQRWIAIEFGIIFSEMCLQTVVMGV